MSARGELCLIERDRLSARTVNLLNQGLNYDAIDHNIVANSLSESADATTYTVNEEKV